MRLPCSESLILHLFLVYNPARFKFPYRFPSPFGRGQGEGHKEESND